MAHLKSVVRKSVPVQVRLGPPLHFQSPSEERVQKLDQQQWGFLPHRCQHNPQIKTRDILREMHMPSTLS